MQDGPDRKEEEEAAVVVMIQPEAENVEAKAEAEEEGRGEQKRGGSNQPRSPTSHLGLLFRAAGRSTNLAVFSHTSF
eukprot:3805908-Rhodomonas_salina.1